MSPPKSSESYHCSLHILEAICATPILIQYLYELSSVSWQIRWSRCKYLLSEKAMHIEVIIPQAWLQQQLLNKEVYEWLNPKTTGLSFVQNVMFICNVAHYKGYVLVRNWFNTMYISFALWISMASCFSSRASVATVLSTHLCLSSCFGVQGGLWYRKFIRMTASQWCPQCHIESGGGK